MFGLSAAKRAARWAETDRFKGVLAAQAAAPGAGLGLSEGIIAGTRIATAMGWRPVEGLVPGDMVMTFDHGLRPVIRVARFALWSGQGHCPRAQMPLAVPVGALGNSSPMLLAPDQTILVESDLAESVFGDPFALIPAAALEGYRGINRIEPHRTVEVVVVQFVEGEVVYANGTGMMHCGSVHGGTIEGLLGAPEDYAALPLDMARAIVAAMIEEDRAQLC